MIRAFILPGEVQLAVQRLVLIPLRWLAVDLRQTRANDGIERFGDDVMLRQEALQRRNLLRGDIDQEIVRAFRWKLLLPAVEQIAAQHQQQRQQHKRQRERRQLAERRPGLVQQTVDRQAHGQGFYRHPFQEVEQYPAQHAAQQRQHNRPGQHRPQQRAAAHQPRQQPHRHRNNHRKVELQRPDVRHHIVAKHTQRLRGEQQAVGPKPHQHRDHRHRAHRPQPRPEAGRRQGGREHRFQHHHQQFFKQQPHYSAGQRRQNQQHQPLADDQLAQLRPARPEGFEDRHQVVAAAAVVPHRHGHRRHRQQQGQQGRQQQELLRALQRFTERPLVLLQPVPAVFRFELRQKPFFIRGKLGGRAAKLIAPGDAAARLYRMGGRDIRGVHQQTRRKLERVKSAVGLLHHFPGDFQRGVADVDTVAGFEVQQRHQTRCQQHRTGRRL